MPKTIVVAALLELTLADDGEVQTAEAIRQAVLEQLDEVVIEQVQGERAKGGGDYRMFCKSVIVAGKQTVDHFEARGTIVSPPAEQILMTSGGVEMTEELIQRYADEAEAGYDLDKLRPRSHG